MCLPDRRTAFLFGNRSYDARADDIHICLVMEIFHLNSPVLETSRQRGGLGEVDFAAKMVECNGFKFHWTKIHYFASKTCVGIISPLQAV